MSCKKLKIDIYSRLLKNDEEKQLFRKIIKEDFERKNKLFDTTKTYFNPVKYYEYYCKYDTLVLCEGMKKFKKVIDVITNGRMNLFNYLTISSLTNAYMGLEGSFNGIYQVCGNLREYLGQAVTGGRVLCLEKTRKKVLKGKFADYDGVSLYPSSIHRLCKEFGLPIGMCKRIETKNKNELDKYSYYVVTVKINKINKHQQLPMVSYKNTKGLLKYTNEVPNEGILTVVDMITLSDWINYQEIEYEILDGVYWNEGYNKRMGQVIEKLFNDRLEYKEKGNEALQQILKLMMNSVYGKTITKKSMIRKKLILKEKFDEYVNNYYHVIKRITKLNDKQYLAVEDDVDVSYNIAQVGIAILSMSKRIMNEVFDIANSNGIMIYYTDTDSMHLDYDNVEKIRNLFKIKYGRELTGKKLGQFHIDFNLKGAGKGEEIYATKSLFLGKKCYIDKLESKDEKGNVINGFHYRMKGVTVAGLEYESKKTKKDMFELYEIMIDNEMEIELNPKDSVSFAYLNHRVYTREEGTFKRTLKF